MITVATEKPKKSDRRKAVYKMYVELTQEVKGAFKNVTDDELVKTIGSYMQLMVPPEDAEEITMSPEEVKQTGLLCAQCLARLLHERSKK